VKAFVADYVLLGDAPPVRDGVVIVSDDGAIDSVGGTLHGLVPERVRGVLFPGLVNAHTHLELSSMRGKVPGGHGFIAWIDRLITLRTETMPEEEEEALREAVSDLVRAATVAVGDVSNGLGTVSVLAERGIGGAIFHEVFGIDREIVLRRVEGLREEAERRAWPSRDLAYAIAPHTLYTLDPDAARALIDVAVSAGRTSLHLAEHPAERRAIEHGDGPVPEWLEHRTRQTRTWPRRPLFDVAEDVGALRPGVLLVHLTDARPDELARVAKSGASAVLCPRSNLFIEGRLPPLLAILEAGLRPALGTDSLASNANVDVLAEARALADRFPQVPAWELVRMATANGADALGRTDLGRIARGARPGLFAIEGEIEGDPARYLLTHLNASRRRVA
jgi:aminodeoxyfutalosine deaminase